MPPSADNALVLLGNMFKSLRRQRWTCPQCTRSQLRRLNGIATAVKPVDSPHLPPASFLPSASQHDDRTLRQIFDNPALGREFTQQSNRQVSGKSPGLFLNRYLTQPEGF